MTYDSHAAKHLGGEKKRSQEVEAYDSENGGIQDYHQMNGQLEIQERVRPAALYVCKSEGRLHHLEMARQTGIEEKWRRISLAYWYLAMTGTYIRHIWVSPFDLYESLIRRSNHQRSTDNPEESDKGKMRLSRESVGNGTKNPAIIATGALIQKELPPGY